MKQQSELFLELLEPHYNSAVQFALGLSKNIADAEDLVHDSLERALLKFEGLKDVTKFRQWLFRIISNEFYSQMRKNKLRSFISLGIPEHKDVIEITDIDQLERNTLLLHLALKQLHVKERQAVLLFEIGEFSIEEIRLIQKEKTLSVIKSRLKRTREKLKKLISELEKIHVSLEGAKKNEVQNITPGPGGKG